jgi:eukaryotic-like serine/threonine-protein kinase
MGTVWRADDVLLGRPVAVKEVELPAGSADAGRAALRERALREARAAARLNHPGVVTLHDVVEADGRLLLVMELVAAPSLGELVERSGPLPPAVAARLGLELVDALEAAHRAGIVHHDVKPANVMVTAAGRAKLADFGIASLQEDGQRTLAALGGPGGRAADRTLTTAFGSLPYVAPEQAAGRAGPAADLWALGATLWFAVEGAAPFERGGPAATLGAILHDPPGQPVRAGPLGPVLLALLDKDPARRPPAAAVGRRLEPLAAPSPAATVPLSGPTEVLPLPGPPRPRRRRDPVPPPGWTAPPRRRRCWGGGCWWPRPCWCCWLSASSAWSGSGSRTPGPRAAPSAAASSTCSTGPATATTRTWTRPPASAAAGCGPPTSTRASAWPAPWSTTSPRGSSWPGSSSTTARSAAAPASPSAEVAAHQ